MFVEHLTIYNFDVEKEGSAIRQYRNTLPDWDCIQKGSRILALEKHEAYFIDMSDVKVERKTDA